MPYVFLFILSIMLPIPALAENPTLTEWTPIPEKSHIRFTTTQMGAEIEGRFEKFDTEIFFEPQQLDKSSAAVTIDITSLNTDYDKRDASLKGSEWFDTEQYKNASFECKEFKLIGGAPKDGNYMCHGSLTIRMITQPVDLPFHLEIKNDTAKMSAETTLDRLIFKLGQGDWADPTIIGQNVKVDIKLTAHSAPE